MRKAVEERLAETARLKAEGDPVMEEILLWHLRYNWGKGINPRKSRIEEPYLINGVKFWRVGHNASHEFYLGTDGNGKKFRLSVGESLEVDWEGKPLVFDEETGLPTDLPGLDERIKEVSDWAGYHGHF